MKILEPQRIGVVITTYNSPEWLRKVLLGYEAQLDVDFTVLIADDGSTKDTEDLLNEFKVRKRLKIEHYWHEDEGFRKTIILNKVIAQTDCDYLIFTDGDCIPRADFIRVHRQFAYPNTFLSGGYIKLTTPVSENISPKQIIDQSIFDRSCLVALGQPKSHKLLKLVNQPLFVKFMNNLTPTKASWNGMNSSGWIADIKAVNGFDERMQYGGLDRELGERLVNAGIKPKQIRYSAICLHLDHPRGYSKPETWKINAAIRKNVVENKEAWTEFGILKSSSQKVD
ncbi:glycosyltransferase family 2 protein [Reinekea sp.]|uniref:glycosyltransferase family 2 protein n=1 Tax=Reinekea sp. TaxID=1970455 RepID=UPI003988BD09